MEAESQSTSIKILVNKEQTTVQDRATSLEEENMSMAANKPICAECRLVESLSRMYQRCLDRTCSVYRGL